MATLLITTRPRYMPDDNDLYNWTILSEASDFYYQNVGGHHLFIHECLPNDGKKIKPKHKIVASWVENIIHYSQKIFSDFCLDDFFLITHDEDLLMYRSNDEGILRESQVDSVHGGLEGKVVDKNIYVFMHGPQHDMFEAIIKDLLEPSVENVKRAIQVIKECKYETKIS